MGGFAGRLGGAALAEVRRLARPLDARGPSARFEAEDGGAAMVVVESGAASAASPVGAALGVLAAVDGVVPNLRALAAEQELDPGLGAGAVFAALVARTGFERAFARLPGDAAAAAWEAASGRGWVARDRAGLRPLAWSPTPGGVAFATEARALANAGFAGELGADGIAALVVLGGAVPPTSIHAGASLLAAGQVLALSAGSARVLPPPATPGPARGERGNVERWAKSVRFGLGLAYGWRARAAVPCALALGGGLASAALLALRPADGGPALALTLRLPWGVEPGVVERAAAAGLRLVEVPFDAEVLAELMAEVAPSPAWARPEAWAWAALARAAWREGCLGLVTGVGARHGFDPVVPGPLGGRGAVALGRLRGGDPAVAVARRYGGFGPGDERILGGLDAPPALGAGEAERWVARRWALPEVELAGVDAAAAAHGLTHVAPFSDPAVLQVAGEVPPAAHHAGGRRALLAGLSGAPATAPADTPVFDAALLAALPLDGLGERVAAWLSPAHVHDQVGRARGGDDAALRRVFALAMLDRGLLA